MKDFIVEVREVWIRRRRVGADSAEEAIEKASKGLGRPDAQATYSHTLPPGAWEAKELDEVLKET